jgi:hypothetical protein
MGSLDMGAGASTARAGAAIGGSAAKSGASAARSSFGASHRSASAAFAAAKDLKGVQAAAAASRAAGGADEIALTAASRTAQANALKAIIKNPYASKAQKAAAQQGLKDLGVKRGLQGVFFNPGGSIKAGNIFKIAASTGIAGVFAWMTFKGLGGVPGSEELDIVDETCPLDMGSPQFAWAMIGACICVCCVCLVLLVLAMSS